MNYLIQTTKRACSKLDVLTFVAIIVCALAAPVVHAAKLSEDLDGIRDATRDPSSPTIKPCPPGYHHKYKPASSSTRTGRKRPDGGTAGPTTHNPIQNGSAE